MKLVLLGMNHRSAPLDVRERLAVADPPPALQKLVACEEIDEAVLLSTCNRVEVTALTRNSDAARLRLRSFFRRELGGDAVGLSERSLDEMLYEYTTPRPRVTCCASPRRSTRWWWASRRSSVRPRTPIGAPSSAAPRPDPRPAVSSAPSRPPSACAPTRASPSGRSRWRASRWSWPRQIFEDVSGKRALLVGAGEMAELALAALRDAGLASRGGRESQPERAAALAVAFGATAHGLDELPRLLADADVVLTSIGATRRCSTCRCCSGAARAARPSDSS